MEELNVKDRPDESQRQRVASELIDVIIKAVHLEHLNKPEITLESRLTQSDLNLDSIDILEVVVAVEHHFGVKVDNAETGKKHFGTIGRIVDFIIAQKGS
jgi:acyl carrier protein